MKIPEYIDELLKRRTRQAIAFDRTCEKVDAWLLKNGIEPDSTGWLGGVETYVNPYASEEEIRRAILCHYQSRTREKKNE